MIAAIRFIDQAVKKTLTAFCAILLLAMVAFTVYSVVMRYVFKDPPIWGDLLTVLSNIWLATALLKYYRAHGSSREDLSDVDWNIQLAM